MDSHRSYRPLLIVVFKLLRLLNNPLLPILSKLFLYYIYRKYYGLTPSAFRILSIFCHCCCSVIVFLMGNQVNIIPHSVYTCSSFLPFIIICYVIFTCFKILGNIHISFASALLFASHPVHVEVYTHIYLYLYSFKFSILYLYILY
jgi:hypothetical protein